MGNSNEQVFFDPNVISITEIMNAHRRQPAYQIQFLSLEESIHV